MNLSYPTKNVYVTQVFGARKNQYPYGPKGHQGVDFRARYADIYAAHDGILTNHSGPNFGYFCKITDSQGRATYYAHLSKFTVKSGSAVKRGQAIAISGNTGTSTAPHLHFALKINGVYVDPMPYFNKEEGDEMLKDWYDKASHRKFKEIGFIQKKDTGDALDYEDWLNTTYGKKKLGDLSGRELIAYMWNHSERVANMQEYWQLKKDAGSGDDKAQDKLNRIDKIIHEK